MEGIPIAGLATTTTLHSPPRPESWLSRPSHAAAHDGLGPEQMAAIRSKFQAASYTVGGQDWERLFAYYDRDHSGYIEFAEFNRAARR